MCKEESIGSKNPLIGVVGPCAAGKSTLVANLSRIGYSVRHIAQEHSYVPAMWQKISNPDVLIYLDVSYSNSIARRSLNWTESEYQEQIRRLHHAYNHANLYIDTNQLNEKEVFQIALSWLQEKYSDRWINSP